MMQRGNFCSKHGPFDASACPACSENSAFQNGEPRPAKPQAPEWVDGLPPVGCICEFRAKGGSLNNGPQLEWQECEVIAATRAYAVLRHIGSGFADIHECSHSLDRIEFRAKEEAERDQMIDKAWCAIKQDYSAESQYLTHPKDYVLNAICQLYDAGLLRKGE